MHRSRMINIIANNIINYIGIDEKFLVQCFAKMILTGNYTVKTVEILVDTMFSNVTGREIGLFNDNVLTNCLDIAIEMIEKINQSQTKGKYQKKYGISFYIKHRAYGFSIDKHNQVVPVDINVYKYDNSYPKSLANDLNRKRHMALCNI